MSNMQLYEIDSIFKTKSFVLFRGKINIHIALKEYIYIFFWGGGGEYKIYILESNPIVLFNIYFV